MRFFEYFLAETAGRAYPILGNVFPRGTGCYAVIGVADCGIIFVSAGTNVYHFCILLFSYYKRFYVNQ